MFISLVYGMIGFNLIYISDHHYQAGRCVEIGIPMFILFVALSQVCGVANIIHLQTNLSYGDLTYQLDQILDSDILVLIILLIFVTQYLKHFQTKQIPVLERFALIIAVTVIWAYAHLLTASGAYKHHPELTQRNCRTDKANLISSAPWLVS